MQKWKRNLNSNLHVLEMETDLLIEETQELSSTEMEKQPL